ncbi:hypothetical protein [Actinoplanes sp. NPDC049265]|uniref:hypothetical protein n=1 Tax=Actinoplanes sp. NPDC049265 TaxID=3363902 RepID=UPI00371429BF
MATSTTPGIPDGFMVDTLTRHGQRCGEPELNLLFNAVRDGFRPEEVTLEAVWHGNHFRRGDLAGVRAAIGRSLTPGDARRLDQLRLEAQSDGRGRVVVTLHEQATVTVESPDAAWAIGKAEQIRRILAHAGGRPRPRRFRPWLWAVAGAFAGGLAGLLAATLAGPAGFAGVVVLASALGCGGAAGCFLVARHMVVRSRPVIWIDGPIPRRGWRSWELRDQIAFVALPLSVVAAVLRVISG